MKRVHTAANLPEAYLIRDLLESRSLVVEIRGEAIGGLAGTIPVGEALPSVWVPEDDAAEALRVIAEFEAEARHTAAQGNWHCTRCGEESEATFTACWSCGTERS